MWALAQAVENKHFNYLLHGPHQKLFYCDNRSLVAAHDSRSPKIRTFFESVKMSLGNVTIKWVDGKSNPVDIFTRHCKVSNIDAEINVKTRLTSAMKDCAKNISEEKLARIHSHANHLKLEPFLKVLKRLGHDSSKVKTLVKKVIADCSTCSNVKNASLPRKQAPGITRTPLTCNETLYIDHKAIWSKERGEKILKLDENGSEEIDKENWDKTEVLTMFEPLARQIQFYPTASHDLIEVKRALRMYFSIYGTPKTIVADNYTTFEALENWALETFNCKVVHTSQYHACSNLSEHCHSAFNSVLDKYNSHTSKYGFENWEDNLTQFVIAHNSIGLPNRKYAPFEVSKNRKIIDVDPVDFAQTDREKDTSRTQLTEKVSKVLKSNLKIKNSVFKHGQIVKIKFKGKPIRFGEIYDPEKTDNPYKTCTKCILESKNGKKLKPRTINKDFICF